MTFSPANNPTVISRITYGNIRVMNGVVHIVDKPLSYLAPYDVTSILEKYASINSPGIRPFNQFVDILRNTGIFNDLREPTKQYTLFIPTNDALSRYKDILNSNDIQQQKNVRLLDRSVSQLNTYFNFFLKAYLSSHVSGSKSSE